MPKISFVTPVKVKKATSVLKAAKKAGLDINAPCGKGKCGKCAIIVKGDVSEITPYERKHFDKEELERGYRLACLVTVNGKCVVELL